MISFNDIENLSVEAYTKGRRKKVTTLHKIFQDEYEELCKEFDETYIPKTDNDLYSYLFLKDEHGEDKKIILDL